MPVEAATHLKARAQPLARPEFGEAADLERPIDIAQSPQLLVVAFLSLALEFDDGPRVETVPVDQRDAGAVTRTAETGWMAGGTKRKHRHRVENMLAGAREGGHRPAFDPQLHRPLAGDRWKRPAGFGGGRNHRQRGARRRARFRASVISASTRVFRRAMRAHFKSVAALAVRFARQRGARRRARFRASVISASTRVFRRAMRAHF